MCERFHRTVLDEFYRMAFRKKIYRTLDELQADLDTWLARIQLSAVSVLKRQHRDRRLVR